MKVPRSSQKFGIKGMRAIAVNMPVQEVMMNGLRRPMRVQMRSERKLAEGEITIAKTPGKLRMNVSPAGFSMNFFSEKRKAVPTTPPLKVKDAHGRIAKITQRSGTSFLQVMITSRVD